MHKQQLQVKPLLCYLMSGSNVNHSPCYAQGSHVLQYDQLVNMGNHVKYCGRMVDQDEDEEKALEKKQRREANGRRCTRCRRGGAPHRPKPTLQPAATERVSYVQAQPQDGVKRCSASSTVAAGTRSRAYAARNQDRRAGRARATRNAAPHSSERASVGRWRYAAK